jgi:peptidoglycan/LPS O-acetylase OafA/YrhL
MGSVAPLTSLRFFAALWVLLFHLRIHLGTAQPLVLERLLQAGPLAMTFFFVLSGFILVVASQGKEPWGDWRGYAWRRFARIYPIYLAYLILFWAVIGFAGDLGGKPARAGALLGLTDLTLTNAWFPQAFLGGFGRDGSWSLSAEVFFYALFPLILLHARQLSDRGLVLALRWSVAFAVLAPVMGKYLPPQGAVPETVYYSLPIFRLPEFAAGVFYATWVLRDRARLPSGRKTAAWIGGLALYVIWVAQSLPYAGNDFILIPALLVLFAYFLRMEKGWAAGFLSTRPMVFLGEISFGIYLMQIVTISLYRQPGHGAGWLGGAFGCFVLTILLAALVHLLVEKPMRAWVLAKTSASR